MRKLVVIVLTGLLCVLAAPAFAHGDIERLRPEPEQLKAKAPDHVMLTFTEAPTEDARVTVTDGCEREMTREKYVQGKTLHVFLNKGEPGKWNVSYNVISAVDGHKTNGQYSFSVKGEADCSEPEPDASETAAEPSGTPGAAADPDTTPTSDESGGIPIAVVAIGALALVGIAFLVRMGASRD